MIDFGKLYCDLHPNQLVTNFCLKQTCMIGLCATCICSHTQFHINNKSTPEYQNIRNTFSSMHQMIRNKIASLDNQKNRIDKINQFIRTKRKTVKQNVQEARRQAIAVINKFFENKQKTMLRQMESEQKKMGLHSQSRMESLMNSLSRQTGVLITSAQQLNSQNFLQSYQRIKTQVVANANKLEDDISRQLDRNEDFQTIINSNDQYLQKIVLALEQSLNLSFKLNHRPLTVQVDRKELSNNISAVINVQKPTSRFEGRIQQNYSVPYGNNKNLSYNDSNNFSAMSFSNVPDMTKQQTACFNEDVTLRQTTKSISLAEDQNQMSKSPCHRQNRSFIKQLCKSDIMKQPHHQNVAQSLIFRQKDTNERVQSLNKTFSNGGLRNHQSQLIVMNNKPFGYQSNANWNQQQQPRFNHHPSLNYSMIQTLQNENNFQNQNHSSQIQYTFSRPCSANKPVKMAQNHVINNGKFNFVPQMFDPNQFNKGNQNYGDHNQCKKVRKSGLTLLKANHMNSTSRSKLHAQ